MIVLDRVFCDLCRAYMGQLFATPVQTPGALADQRLPPYVCACPDCWDASSVEPEQVAA
jgi:hypothetical protein